MERVISSRFYDKVVYGNCDIIQVIRQSSIWKELYYPGYKIV